MEELQIQRTADETETDQTEQHEQAALAAHHPVVLMHREVM
jgi:hypothetical protein